MNHTDNIVNVSTEQSPATTLQLETVVAAALALVDEGGLESLTMRRLATSLGAHLPTLYRLFGNKDALIDDMAEAILAGASAGADPPHGGWADGVKGLATSLRSALLDQRDGAQIVGGNYAAKQHNLTFIDNLVACTRASGLTDEHALWAASSVFCFVLGEALEQQGATGSELDTLKGVARPDRYPHLTTGPVELFFDFDARFTFGLDLLIAGMRQNLR